MTLFEMVKYHGRDYPPDIPLRTEEISAHFGVKSVSGDMKWSLHTEYSYTKRDFNIPLLCDFPEILSAQKDGVPQLWKNDAWASQFADFIFKIVGDRPAPRVIEIHPPFNDYSDISVFLQVYSVFEAKIKTRFPETTVLIENRCGSVYHGGKFILSKITDLTELCDKIEKSGLGLKIAYDVPQIYTAHNAKTEEQYLLLLESTRPLRSYIGGVHLWGKRLSASGRKVSHCGDLNTYFGDEAVKNDFLNSFCNCFNDDVPRNLVLEVNSGNDDVLSIISDLKSVGIRFV